MQGWVINEIKDTQHAICELQQLYDLVYEPGLTDNLVLKYNLMDCPGELLSEIYGYIKDISAKNSKKAKAGIERLLSSYRTVHFIDKLLSMLIDNAASINMRPHLSNFAKELVFYSENEEMVKLGISLLGIIGCDRKEIEQIKLLALNEEYTMYCITSIETLLVEPYNLIWAIAQNTYGWGRINCIQRLKKTDNPAIKQWLLYEGYQNTVMNEYTAYICATTGGLHQALEAASIDDMLLNSATDIINSLLIEGIAFSFKEYLQIPSVFTSYVRHMGKTAGGIKEHATLIRILSCVADESNDWGAKYGWSNTKRFDLIDAINRILIDGCWGSGIIELAVDSRSENDVILISNYFNIDIWDLNWKKLQSNPLNPRYWETVMSFLDEKRMQTVAIHMRKALPWRMMMKTSSGYSNTAVEEIVKHLCGFPGHGRQLILMMLKSPVKKIKKYSLNILKSLGSDKICEEMKSLIFKVYEDEKDEQVRQELSSLLSVIG